MASPHLSITWSDLKRGAPTRKRWELLEPGGFLLIAWLERLARERVRAGSQWKRYALEYSRTQLPPNGPNAPGLPKRERQARTLTRMLHAWTYVP